ncbi:MAG: segregation/condensation protein A, partial [Candidatus Vogelbacteria bacterium]|nr:segregation/condensation protein A [Candidatus Vogelbacteria bacterium]
MEEFLLKMANFEGPLDLLLSLIEKRKLHVSDVSLAQVTDDYIAFIRSGENISVENMANFILIASTLILIKSYSLISTLAVTEEEKADIKDLENRLKLYQRVREL